MPGQNLEQALGSIESELGSFSARAGTFHFVEPQCIFSVS